MANPLVELRKRKRKPYFEIEETEAGWHVRLMGANHQVVLWSENYPDERTARGAVLVARLAATSLVHVVPKGPR